VRHNDDPLTKKERDAFADAVIKHFQSIKDGKCNIEMRSPVMENRWHTADVFSLQSGMFQKRLCDGGMVTVSYRWTSKSGGIA